MVDVPSSRGIEDMMDYMAGRMRAGGRALYMESPSTGAETLYFCGCRASVSAFYRCR